MEDFEVEFTLTFVNVTGLGAAGVLREPIYSNRSFQVISTPKMFLNAFETL